MRLSLDSLLILVFFAALVACSLVLGGPVFESVANSRMSYLSVISLPVLLGLALRRKLDARIVRALGDWWQVFAVLLVYESMKHLRANQITLALGIHSKDALMLRLDEALFFGKTPALWLQPLATAWFTRVMWFFYGWVYYLGPVVALGWAYAQGRDPELFRRLRQGIVFCLLGGYLSYLVVPVAGPLFTVGAQFQHPILTQRVLGTRVFDVLRYNWDCFPSLHTAVSWLIVFLLWPRAGRMGRVVCAVGAAGVTLATLVLRYHYGVDLIAGVAWASLVAFAMHAVPALGRTLRIPLPRLDWPAWGAHRVRWLGAVFLVSGGVGALLEVAHETLIFNAWRWDRSVSREALAAYLVAMGAGVLATRPFAMRSAQPLRMLAGLQCGVGLWAIVLLLWPKALRQGLRAVPQLAGPGWVGPAVHFAVVLALFVPPGLLMGCAFPVAARALRSIAAPGEKWTLAAYGLAHVTAMVGVRSGLPSWLPDGAVRVLVVALLTSVGLGVLLVNLGMAWHARAAEAVDGGVLSGL